MMECKMTCNPNGMLWPLPTGKVELSKELLHFYPGDLSIEVDDDTSFEVYGLVSKFSSIFKDYLYQMHPNYDLNSKGSPFSDGKQKHWSIWGFQENLNNVHNISLISLFLNNVLC